MINLIPSNKQSLLVILLLVVVLICACSQRSTPTPSPPPSTVVPSSASFRTTITFAISGMEQATYQELVRTFEEENPYIQVELVLQDEVLGLAPGEEWPEDTHERLFRLADVVLAGRNSDLTEQNLVRDLTPLIEIDPVFYPEDFLPGTLGWWQWDNGLWGLPTRAEYDIIYFNKGLFDAAGIPYPQVGWSWDDFLDTVRALTLWEDDQISQWGFVPGFSGLLLPVVHGQIDSLVDTSTDPPTPRLAEAGTVEAVRWYTDLLSQEPGIFDPAQVDYDHAVVETLIGSGQVALWEASFFNWPTYRRQVGNVGMVAFPRGAVHANTTPSSPISALAMSAGTTQPELAWRLMRFISQQYLPGGGLSRQTLPARRSTIEANNLLEQLEPEHAAVLQYAMDHGFTINLEWELVYSALAGAVGAVLREGETVEAALQQAQSEAQAALNERMIEQAQVTPAPSFVAPSAGEPETAPAGSARVRFGLSPAAASKLQAYQAAAQSFQQIHPEWQVEVDSASVSGLAGMAANHDCFQWSLGFPLAESSFAILNLDPFLDAEPSLAAGDFYPALLESLTWQGQLWGLPAEAIPYLMVYNQELFDAAGLPYPEAGWTTDDFLALAVALTVEDKGQYGFVPEANELDELMLFLDQLNAGWVDVSVDPPNMSFTEPAVVEAMSWYVDLAREHGVKPVLGSDPDHVLEFYDRRETLINTGRAATWSSYGGRQLTGGREALHTDWAPLPVQLEGVPRASHALSGYFISAQGQDPQLCFAWLSFLTAEPAVFQGIPARRSVAESAGWRQVVGSDRADLLLKIIGRVEGPSTAQLLASNPWLAPAKMLLGRAYQQVVEGQATVEEALNAAQPLFDSYRACVVSNNGQFKGCLAVLETD